MRHIFARRNVKRAQRGRRSGRPTPSGWKSRWRGFEPLEPRCLLNGTVVLNELMYHPAGGTDETLEWIELYNQMAVDMDLSAWELAGGVNFKFPEGTILSGGKYLVVAANPAALQAATGFAGALGPLSGQMANEGERIELRNNSQRTIDAVDYRDDGDWPTAPDGSGATLAKIGRDMASEPAANWRTSMEIGGTPGRVNFPEGAVVGPEVPLLAIGATWWYDDSATDRGTAWKEPAYSPQAAGWRQGAALLYNETAALPAAKNTLLTLGANTYYFRTDFQYAGDPNAAVLTVNHAIDDGAVFYLNGSEIYRYNMPDGPVGYGTAAVQSVLNAELSSAISIPATGLVAGSNVLAVEVHQAPTSGGAGFRLVETGGDNGSGGVPENLALASRGATAFAKDVLGGYPSHTIPHLNDGAYGNPNSWIGNSSPTFAGVALAQAKTIDRVAFGRDNTRTYSDRSLGTYTLQYTTVASPNQNTPDSAWQTIAAVTYDGAFPDSTPSVRHVWGFDPVSGVTGVRIAVSIGGISGGICIDEIEVYEPDLPDVVFGTSLTATEVLQPAPTLVFNEVAGALDGAFWLELANTGGSSLEVGGAIVASSAGHEYVLPSRSVPAGGLVSLTAAELRWTATEGDKLFLYNAARSMVLDAVRVDAQLRGRSPQHGSRWLFPDGPTPGDPNSFTFPDEVVINEIMYHPFESPLTGDANEEWIELFNRGTSTVDLSGWKIAEAVDFTVPAGTTLAAGEYLVVSNDAVALRLKYPGIRVVGDFSRDLSNHDDRILLLDARGNPADEVHYYDGGRWAGFADGGGSSLELRDPDADNSKPEAWAASVEGARSAWKTYTYRGIAKNDGGSEQWREFVMQLNDSGEVLLDDISVIEDPNGTARQLIQNTSFTAGTTDKWRILGTHQGRVITDPDDPGNKVLHLVASGAGEDRMNHAETTLVGNVAVVNGREYQISYRAKWLHGSNLLNTRLYFNRLAATTVLDVPDLHGTPGARNSVVAANIGPTYSDLLHSPVVPNPGQPVTVSVTAADPDGVGNLKLWYAVAGAAAQQVPMAHIGNGTFQGTIPGQTTATIVQFYVEGTDALGASSYFPADGPDSRALYKVQDNQAKTGLAYNFRIIMTAADTTRLHASTNLMSDAYLGATIVYRESEVFYDAGVHLQGSNAGRGNDAYLNFGVAFDPMQPFRGIHEKVKLDRSGRGGVVPLAQDEIVVKQILNHAGGMPSLYDDLVYVIAPNPAHSRTALLVMDRYQNDYLDSLYDNGSEGLLYKMDVTYVSNGTIDGNVESLKTYNPYNHPPTRELADYGDNKESYRWFLYLSNHVAQDDYTRIIELCKTMHLSGTALAAAAKGIVDVDEWMRVFAVLSLSGVEDAYTRSWNHNVQWYIRPEDNRVMALPWDWDNSTFSNSTSASLVGPVSNASKLANLPGNLRLFHGHLLDIINTTYNATYLTRWLTHYGAVAGQNFAPIINYVNARRSFVLANLLPQVAFAVTSNGGADYSVPDAAVTLEGTGWINVREVRLAGQAKPLEVTWLDNSRWQVTLPLAVGANQFAFTAYDHQGQQVGSDTITVTSTLVNRPLQDYLRLSEINYNPPDPTPAEIAQGFADNDDFEFIELVNTGPAALDVGGVQLTNGVTFEVTGSYQGPSVLITEAGTTTPDWLEIQNVSPGLASTAGWVVAVNNATNSNINAVVPIVWNLPATMTAGQVLYKTDSSSDNYWGSDIYWRTNAKGWVMIVDDAGRVADFVVWGYSDAEIASFNVTVNGFQVTAADAWAGAAVSGVGAPLSDCSAQRRGGSDHNDASDWAFVVPQSKGVQNTGLTVPFELGPVMLAPGQYIVLASNDAAFRARYGDISSLAGQYTGRLDNGGERLTLTDSRLAVIADFRYDDAGSWPGRADGKGSSLELIDPAAVPKTEPQKTAYLQDGSHWRSSSEYGGSPGLAGSGPQASVVINEVLSHSDPPLQDAIELMNATVSAIDVGGWYLSDSGANYAKFRIPAGTIIPAGGYLVFTEDDFNPDPLAPGPNDFALDGAHGDDVWLVAADAAGKLTRFVDHVEFDTAGSNETFGRWPNGAGELYPMVTPTLDPAHGQNSGPRIGPVIISELNYRPRTDTSDDLEFIEIYNPTATAVDLTNWRIGGGVGFDFPAGATLGPHATLVVVPFSLSNATKLTAWRSFYGAGPAVAMLGGYDGTLADAGGKVRLKRPDAPPHDEPTFIPHVLEDEVHYTAAWYPLTDGGGQSLNRLGSQQWGNVAASWTAAAPNPGAVQMVAQVAGRAVFYNQSAFDGNDAAASALDDAAVAVDKRALLPGQTATIANYTSYSRGINGIMIDLVDLPPGAAVDAADFRFRVGNDNDPGTWTAAPPPSSISVRPNADGTDRVTLIWPDSAIQNKWLQVTVLATGDTGLGAADVFYFGNAVGESGDSAGDARVTAADVLLTRGNPRTFIDPAPINFAYDFNRDARVNAVDMLLARNNQTTAETALWLITVPSAKGAKSLGWAPPSKSGAARGASRTKAAARDASAPLDWLSEYDRRVTKRASCVAVGVARQAVDRVLAEH